MISEDINGKRNMSLHITLSRLIVLATTLVLVGCAPAQLMPQFDDTTLRTKQRNISNQTKRFPRQISEDPSATLRRIYDRLESPATKLCIANGEKWLQSSCSNWKLIVIDDENFNAYATPDHEIIFTTTVFKYTRSDDELAFILGHEMGHHILNHSTEDMVNAEIMGATVGIFSAVVTGAIAGALGADADTTKDVMTDYMEDGWESGRESGRLIYSIDQESEADKLALQLIALSGYSESEARKIMIHIHADADMSNLRSVRRASHPTGPERLAAFDLYASLPMATPNQVDLPNIVLADLTDVNAIELEREQAKSLERNISSSLLPRIIYCSSMVSPYTLSAYYATSCPTGKKIVPALRR
tara:strand:- start:2134 stop:3210 length:1077 start_codon:yes stop_codon:yes gene_type:complete